MDVHDTKNDKKRSLTLVDGSGFIFRAYYALPPLTRKDGTPINAVMGYCNMIWRLIAETKTDSLAVIFDVASKTFRNEIYKEYKANRSEAPEDLIPQFSLIREATKAFNIPYIELAGYEADDIIATYASQASKEGWEVEIISSDKDLMQLVKENVKMIDPMKMITIDKEGVFKKFGVYPDKVIDVQALAGDSTDNIPGVPGIGIKTAAELINKYGAVSEQICLSMVKNLNNISKTNISLSITGIAGPSGGTKKKPIGLVYIGITVNKKTIVFKKKFNGSRKKIQKEIALFCLNTLYKLT